MIDSKLKSPIGARLFRPRSPLNLSSVAPTRVDSTATPSNDDAYSRKRNRKRVTTGSDEESAFSSTENYPREFPKVRGSANKSGRLRGTNFVESRKGNLEKFVDEQVARNIRDRNIQGNAARTGNTLEHAGPSGKLHEKKDTRKSPASIENGHLSVHLRKSDENPAIGDKTSKSADDGACKSSQTSEDSGPFKEEVESSTNTDDPENSVKETVATSTSLESHRDDKIPAVAEQSPRSNNYVHRSSLLSAVDPPATSTDSWTNEPEQRSARTRSDGVENGEEDGKYERHEGRQVENHEDERAPEGVKDGADVFEKGEDGRHAAKYDVRVEDDVASDGTHDTESHRSVKEGAAGRGMFEKGGATEREQEHRESDGEKGEKVRLSI